MTRSAELEDLCRTWHGEIPLTAAMGLEPLSFDGAALVVGADLAPNVNVHGTAFAGSLYAIAALSGWGLVHLCLQRAGVDGSIVIADGHIRYLKPVAERIEARCTMAPELLADGLEALAGDSGKTRFPLRATIEANGRTAAEFDGVYAVMRRTPGKDRSK